MRELDCSIYKSGRQIDVRGWVAEDDRFPREKSFELNLATRAGTRSVKRRGAEFMELRLEVPNLVYNTASLVVLLATHLDNVIEQLLIRITVL
jgi:hypothetical protein